LNDTPNYADIICSWNYRKLAEEYKIIGEIDKMWNALSESVRHAVRFDEKPSYETGDINFMQDFKGSIKNNSSENACAPLLRHILNDFCEFKNDIKYTEIIDMLRKSQRNKKQSGI
jgi:hypothetical protein